jgi:hypothetical protein
MISDGLLQLQVGTQPCGMNVPVVHGLQVTPTECPFCSIHVRAHAQRWVAGHNGTARFATCELSSSLQSHTYCVLCRHPCCWRRSHLQVVFRVVLSHGLSRWRPC